MRNPPARSYVPLLLGCFVAVMAACSATTAQAVMLVELALNATARPYGPDAPVVSQQQQFTVPGGPGTLIMTYTEQAYVGGPGGFTLDPKDLSSERLGFGGETTYTPRTAVRGQPYEVRSTWLHDFSKKVWVATLTARHEYQAFQIRNRGRQFASILRLTVEFIPGTAPITGPQSSTLEGTWELPGGNMTEVFADGTGHDSRGNSLTWTLLDAARGIYELHWSHGYTDKVTLAPDGKTISGVNNTGFHWDAVRRGPLPQPTATGASALPGSWNWGAGGGIVEILPDGTGRDSRGNTMRWTLRNAATGSYELKWSHGFTDTATLSSDGNSVAIVNNVGTRFVATRRIPVSPPPATTPLPPTAGPQPTTPQPPPQIVPLPPMVPPPMVPPPPAATFVPPGADQFDSTSILRGDPFNGGEWANSRNDSAFAMRTLESPVCINGLSVASAGTDITSQGSSIRIMLTGPAGTHLVLDLQDAVISRGFSGGGSGNVLPPQSRSFQPIETTRIEVRMTGHGWFLMQGLTFSAVPCR